MRLVGFVYKRKTKKQQKNRWLGAFVGLMVLSLGVFFAAANPIYAATDISGVVFTDYNGNGVRDNATGATANRAADTGVANATIKAFDSAGTNCATTTSGANGAYTLSMGSCSGSNFRVEFSALPAGTSPTQVGSQNATTTQFVAGGGTANLGLNSPGDFCQNNPLMATSCYRGGDRNDSSTVDVQTASPYNASGTSAPTFNFGDKSVVGSTWGEAFRRTDRSIFTGAFTKRHADYGVGGIGAIYKATVPTSNSGTATPSLYVTIPNAGADRHPVSNTNCAGRDGTASAPVPSGENCWFWDQFSFGTPGKTGLGGMDIYEDLSNPANDALFVVNLNNKNMYKVTNLNSTGTVSAPITMPITLPGAAQGCAQVDVRPFALTIQDGVGYAGFTCTAQSTSNVNNLRSYVYSFNPTTNVFGSSPILEVPLNFERGCTVWLACPPANWNYWTDTFNNPPISVVGTTHTYPSPLLSDITFGPNGTMSLGIRDRFADQLGTNAFDNDLGSSDIWNGVASGDIMRACKIGSTWTLENAGTCNGVGPGPSAKNSADTSRGQGPGGNEFYNNEFLRAGGFDSYHDEISVGGLGSIPGFNEVAQTVFDPLDDVFYASGTETFNTNTAAKILGHQIDVSPPDDNNPTVDTGFGKANGVGDLEALCDLAPIEVGNRLWQDTNNNGVQDPGEAPLAGVTVHLYNTGNTLIGTSVTDVNGNFLFSNRTVDENGTTIADTASRDYNVAGLTANTSGYTVKLDNASDYASPSLLQGRRLSPANATTNSGNDQNDSDATLTNGAQPPAAGNAPTIAFSTTSAGANNHTFDFGLVPEVSIGSTVWNDINANGILDGSETSLGINGVTVNLYGSAADTNSDGQLSSAEVAAATAVATTTTANDPRAGATNGRPGFYRFTALAAGSYFVQVAPANFTGVNPLVGFTNSVTPAGVADTQDDNRDHGAVPAGGSQTANGIVSVAINLQPGQEPTTSTTKTDDDTDNNSDMTVDFGFNHPYSLGNRVWLDNDNSGTINGADGATPGIAGVTVVLLDSANNAVDSDPNTAGIQPTVTTTDSAGYYRFDNLLAGSYKVQIPASNFISGGPLELIRISSISGAESNNPNDNVDSNDDGINPPGAGQAVMSGVIALGPGGVEPINEVGVVPGQGTDDAFANMTLDFGFTQPPYKGDTVFFDLNGDGTQQSNEPGIANVTVRLINTTTTAVVATTTTNAQGKYMFNEFAPGTYTVTVDTTTVPGGTATTPTSINNPAMGSGDAILTDDFGFNQSGVIGNQIWNDSDVDGTFDAGEPGIAGVTVDLYQDQNNNGAIDPTEPVISTTTTDSSGTYQFTNLLTNDNIATIAGAQYVVRVTDTANAISNFSHVSGSNAGANNNSQNPLGYAVTLTNGAPSNQTADFGYALTSSLGDFVWEDSNGNGLQDSGEPGITGVTVELLNSGGTVISTTTTDSTGHYLFPDLFSGSYSVRITPPTGYVATTQNVAGGDLALNSNIDPTSFTTPSVTLVAGTDDLTIDAGLVQLVNIGDFVWEDTNNDGLQDPSEPGRAGVTVELLDGNCSPIDSDSVTAGVQPTTIVTDVDGNYLFQNLYPRSYCVRFTAPDGYLPAMQAIGSDRTLDSNPNTATFTTPAFAVTSGNDDLTIDAGIIQDASLAGKIWIDKNKNGQQDSDEPFFPNLKVELLDGDGTVVATQNTDASGNYLFDHLRPGDYQIRFQKPDGYVLTQQNTGSDNTDNDANLTTFTTALITLAAGEHLVNIDAGVVTIPVIASTPLAGTGENMRVIVLISGLLVGVGVASTIIIRRRTARVTGGLRRR